MSDPTERAAGQADWAGPGGAGGAGWAGEAGGAAADAALAALAALDGLPVAEHPAVYEAVHRRLQAALEDASDGDRPDEGDGRPGAVPPGGPSPGP